MQAIEEEKAEYESDYKFDEEQQSFALEFGSDMEEPSFSTIASEEDVQPLIQRERASNSGDKDGEGESRLINFSTQQLFAVFIVIQVLAVFLLLNFDLISIHMSEGAIAQGAQVSQYVNQAKESVTEFLTAV